MSQSILVIDDDEGVRDAFDLALEDSGYRVLLASGGIEGLEIAARETIDMIFLDLKMPDIDGVETMRRLRASGCSCPIYIVTAFMPEYLDQLSVAAKEGLLFGLGQKPLSADQIRSIARGSLTGPEAIQ